MWQASSLSPPSLPCILPLLSLFCLGPSRSLSSARHRPPCADAGSWRMGVAEPDPPGVSPAIAQWIAGNGVRDRICVETLWCYFRRSIHWIIGILPSIDWAWAALQAYAQIIGQREHFLVTYHNAIRAVHHRFRLINDELRGNEPNFEKGGEGTSIGKQHKKAIWIWIMKWISHPVSQNYASLVF